MESEKHWRVRRTIYLSTILVSLGFLVAGILFIFYASSQSNLDTLSHINGAVQQSRFNVDNHISEEFQILNAGMILNEEREWLDEDGSFDRMVKRILGSSTYTRVGVAGLDGDALWADRKGHRIRADLSEAVYIQKALAGENAISEPRWDEASGVYVTDYAVPAYNADGSLRGVLFASDPEDELRAIADNSLFADEGFVQIIKKNGEYVVKSQSPLRLAGDESIFDLPEPLTMALQQKMLDDMSAGRAGYFVAKIGGGNRMVAYAPSSYNNWYIHYSVPENLVNAGLQSVTNGAVGVVVIAGGIFLFFILMIRHYNNRARKELERLAFADPLTGGRNLQRFMIDVRKLLAETPQERYAICYGDIKGFKYINDIFGRGTGDQLLRYLWNIMEDESQEREFCARSSADIFVAIRLYESKELLEERYRELTEQLALFPVTAAQGYKVELYGGIYVIDKKDGALTLEDMLDRALEAQQEIKHRGGGSRLAFYSNEMRAQKRWDTEVESRMEQALAGKEFKLYLQPKISIQDGDRMMGMEALVRWEPPDQAMIPPSRFIDLFERNGFILNLDQYMLEEACRTYKELNLEAMNPPPVLSVNVSRLSLLQSDIVQCYAGIKQKHGMQDGLIELEFTEGLLFENHKRFQAVVEEFRSHGFLCSLDDFGSGYSSLNILKSLKVDVLKLDRLFFDYSGDEVRGRELVKMIISLAKFLHIKTVAEGIEDEAEVCWLREIGCDAVQGYVFSRPLPVEDFRRFLRRWEAEQ